MPSYIPAQNGSEIIYYVSLVDQADTLKFKANPTIAAGDFKVVADDGALANLTTLPVVSPAGSTRVKIVVSAAESAGDNISVIGIDAAGAEWADIEIPVQTSAQQIDDLSVFTASTDAVANVTLVGTTTTNTDMRGTDSANTVAPDNAGITANGVAIAALPDAAANALAVLETQLNETYVGEGIPPTLTQAVMIMHQLLQQFAFVGSTNTVKALDKTTTIAIYDNLDAANPVSSDRIL